MPKRCRRHAVALLLNYDFVVQSPPLLRLSLYFITHIELDIISVVYIIFVDVSERTTVRPCTYTCNGPTYGPSFARRSACVLRLPSPRKFEWAGYIVAPPPPPPRHRQSVSQSGSRRRTMEMPPCSVYKRYNVESQDGCCGNAAPISMQCNLSGWEPLCRARFSLNGPVQGVSYVRGGRRVPPTHNGFESRWL